MSQNQVIYLVLLPNNPLSSPKPMELYNNSNHTQQLIKILFKVYTKHHRLFLNNRMYIKRLKELIMEQLLSVL